MTKLILTDRDGHKQHFESKVTGYPSVGGGFISKGNNWELVFRSESVFTDVARLPTSETTSVQGQNSGEIACIDFAPFERGLKYEFEHHSDGGRVLSGCGIAETERVLIISGGIDNG